MFFSLRNILKHLDPCYKTGLIFGNFLDVEKRQNRYVGFGSFWRTGLISKIGTTEGKPVVQSLRPSLNSAFDMQ